MASFFGQLRYLLVFVAMLVISIHPTTDSYAQTHTIDSLNKVLSKARTFQKRALIYNQLSEAYKIISPDTSFKKAQTALSLAKKANDKEQEAHALNNLGEYYLDKGIYNQAIDFFKQALQIANSISNNSIKATCLNKIGVVHYLKNEYETCLNYQHEALHILRKTRDKQKTAQVYSLMSYTYAKQSKYNEALSYHFKAFAIREELGDQNEIAKSLNSIGDFYQQQQNYKQAIESYSKALEVSTKINSLKGKAISWNNLGVCYAQVGRIADAKKAHFKGLLLKKKMAIPKEIAISLKNLGDVFLQEKQLDSALYFYGEAQKIQTQLNNKEALLRIDIQITEIFVAKKDFAKAIIELKDALSQAQKINSQLLLKEVYQKLYQTCALQGNATQFLKYYQLYDSLQRNSESPIEEINIEALKQRYEYEKRQKEYELLKKENQIKNLELTQRAIFNWLLFVIIIGAILLIIVLYLRVKMRYKENQALSQINAEVSALNQKLQYSEAQLQKSNKVKNKFLSIISHDLRAPLASLLSLLQILQDAQSEEDGFSQEMQQEMFTSLGKQVAANLHLLDNLLQWSKAEAEMIRFKPILVELKEFVAEVSTILSNETSKKEITITLEVPEKLQVYADEDMLRAILLNLLNNAIKFSALQGLIRIVAEEIPHNFVVIKVCDNGVGMSEDEVNQLFTSEHLSKRGTAQEKGTGLGLLLCKEFVERHQGTLTVESQEKKGACFTFTLPSSEEIFAQSQTRQ